MSWNVYFLVFFSIHHCNHPFLGGRKFGPNPGSNGSMGQLKIGHFEHQRIYFVRENAMHLSKHLLCLVSMKGLGQ